VARVYRVKLDTVRVGDITLNNVDALVHESEMPFVLLGMSFLNRVEMRREGTDLTLTKRY
jgi:aspartyl protease family protein